MRHIINQNQVSEKQFPAVIDEKEVLADENSAKVFNAEEDQQFTIDKKSFDINNGYHNFDMLETESLW